MKIEAIIKTKKNLTLTIQDKKFKKREIELRRENGRMKFWGVDRDFIIHYRSHIHL